MTDYAMLYQQIILKAWKTKLPWSDPLELGSAAIFEFAPNNINEANGHELKFGLSAALRKLIIDYYDQYPEDIEAIMELDNKLWSSVEITDACRVLDGVKLVLEDKLGMEFE